MSHTKEPWHVAPGVDYCDIVCQDHVDIARTDIEEDARRIVACVNACAGIPNDVLEDKQILKADADLRLVREGLIKHNGILGREAKDLERQRDELLAALNRIMALPEKHPQDPIACVNETHLIAECAIASAKGGA